ncbi:DUF29 domain-containing protein [Azospirillum sp. B506]|uniref:DUF29 domain-containing protein n=1 Tax=Azospirillum sp. B506 TaxID=137721 RepID=UPI0005B25BC4|nr:DUF29 domain-containing protein [Azospirillum sp. B506]
MDSRIGYDTDFYAWALEQGRLLREASKQPTSTPVDWENVAEEIESIGRRERRDLQDGIRQVMIGLLRFQFTQNATSEVELRLAIMRTRFDIKTLLEDSPSLHSCIDLSDLYGRARLVAITDFLDEAILQGSVPADCPYSLKQILAVDWWPTNVFGKRAV